MVSNIGVGEGSVLAVSVTPEQARAGLCATVPWHMGPYWDIKWALDNSCSISVFVNIQRCLKHTIRQYETKIKGTEWE